MCTVSCTKHLACLKDLPQGCAHGSRGCSCGAQSNFSPPLSSKEEYPPSSLRDAMSASSRRLASQYLVSGQCGLLWVSVVMAFNNSLTRRKVGDLRCPLTQYQLLYAWNWLFYPGSSTLALLPQPFSPFPKLNRFDSSRLEPGKIVHTCRDSRIHARTCRKGDSNPRLRVDVCSPDHTRLLDVSLRAFRSLPRPCGSKRSAINSAGRYTSTTCFCEFRFMCAQTRQTRQEKNDS